MAASWIAVLATLIILLTLNSQKLSSYSANFKQVKKLTGKLPREKPDAYTYFSFLFWPVPHVTST